MVMALKKFPQNIRHYSWNSRFKESWTTQVQTSGSGKSKTMTNQLYPGWVITESVGFMSNEMADELMGFVALVKGAYEPFLWLDHTKCHEEEIQLPMVAPGRYQAVRKIGPYIEPADYIEDVSVKVNGALKEDGYSISNGLIIFSVPPAGGDIVTASYTYWWKVRFKDDGMGITRIFDDLNTSDSFKMEVVR